MQNRTRLITAALAGTLVPLALSVPAHAQDPLADHQACVANREANGGAAAGMGRTEVERRWEVTGLGSHRTTPGFGWAVVAYPWCGHGGKYGDIDEAWVGAVYSDRRHLRVVIEWDSAGFGNARVVS